MDEIKTLVFSDENWTEKYSYPKNVNLIMADVSEKFEKKLYDVVFVDRRLMHKEMNIIQTVSKAYCVFFTDKVEMNEAYTRLLLSRKGRIIHTEEIQNFFDVDIRNYFASPYGEKYRQDAIKISGDFTGDIKWHGYNSVELSGEFGEDYAQLIYWGYNIPIYKEQNIDLYLEYSKSENVSVKLCVSKYKSGAIAELQEHYEFDEEELEDYISLDNDGNDGSLFIYLMVCGYGTISIRGLHDRIARRGAGHFLPGGEIYKTTSGEEVFCYFDPGDMRPPLNIYFSGYKTREGFEGYYMFKNMGCPFLLLAEARLEGGSFYMGDAEYEELIVSVIRKYMDELGFESSDVMMAGLSMGTTGAMYYSSEIRPGSVIIGKPLASLGDIAAAELRSRPGGFATSIDVLEKLTGGSDEKCIEELNNRFWDKFDNADFSETKFVVAYMIEDDYDATAYKRMIEHLKSSGVTIYGKGLHGRHNDDTNGIVYWFSDRYKHVLWEDYKRNMEK